MITVSTQTDANGEFLLTDVIPGEGVLVIDGRSANQGKRSYGYYEYRTTVGAGVTNALPFIIWMPFQASLGVTVTNTWRSPSVLAVLKL